MIEKFYENENPNFKTKILNNNNFLNMKDIG